MYWLVFTKEAQNALRRLPRNMAILIREKLVLLAANQYAPTVNATRLQNRAGYRLRIGSWRVIYEIQGDEMVILVVKIAGRGEVYR